MILRRVIAHFKKQEWTAIVLDFLIVVAGVFVGIQVSNWNDAQSQARQGVVFSERLVADLRVEAWSYDILIDYLGDVAENAVLALRALSSDSDASDEELLIYAYRATQYGGGVRRRATFDELTSTGSIGLIKDASLRDTAVLVYNTAGVIDQATQEGRESLYRIAFRRRVPHAVQFALTENCGDRFAPIGDYSFIGNQLNYECKTGLSPEEIEQAATLLRSDPEIIELLRLRAMDVQTLINNLTFTNQDVMESLHAIARTAP